MSSTIRHAPFAPGDLSGRGEIRSLTGLRGWAATMVMLYHFSLNLPSDAQLFGAFHRGYLYVDLFFVLSGFVMAYSQSRNFAHGYAWRGHLAFLLERLARIYPLYALVTLETAVLVLLRGDDVGLGGLLRTLALNLAMVQAWGLAPSLEGAAWSISTEWAAYLLFPVLLLSTLWSSRLVAVATALTALAVLIGLTLCPGELAFSQQGREGPLDIYSSATALPLLRCVAEFMLGLVAFRIARDCAGVTWSWGAQGALASILLIAAGFGGGSDVVVVGLFAVLIVFLSPDKGLVARVLGSTVPYRLGQWSYSIYLIHDKFSHLARSLQQWFSLWMPLASEITMMVMSACVIACSAISFHVVETPLRRLLSSPVRRWRVRQSEPLAGAPLIRSGDGADALS